MILDRIIAKKQETLEADLQKLTPANGRIAKLMKQSDELFVIGELKKASPSKGLIVPDFQIASLAKQYDEAGVNAISVLTEQHFFQGDLSYIRETRKQTALPILRKDFIMDVREIAVAKQAGADLILLIAAMLDDAQLALFYQMARLLGLECIVEVHDQQELQRALAIHPEIIGINNRSLHTFEVTLETTKQLAKHIPDPISIVAESGIFTHEDMNYVKEAGADAVLIGESFMRSSNIKQHLQELRYGKD